MDGAKQRRSEEQRSEGATDGQRDRAKSNGATEHRIIFRLIHGRPFRRRLRRRLILPLLPASSCASRTSVDKSVRG